MRLIIFSFVVLFLCIYAWRDWYKSLCGLVVMMAVINHETMPEAMFGIVGLNPSNMLLLNVILAWMAAKKREQRQWDMPAGVNFLLFAYTAVVLVALIRYGFNQEGARELAAVSGRRPETFFEVFADNFINSFKWVFPGILLYSGCNSKERFLWGMVSLMLMYLALAVLVIRWMPLGLLVDGDALQRRAAKVLGREIGYYRTNLSVMLAGAFWMIMAAKHYFADKYSLPCYGCAGIVLMAMMLTGGRGGYLAWAVVGVIVSFAKYRKYLILAPPMVLLVLTFVPSVKERMMMGFGDSAKHEYKTTAEGTVDENNLGTISAGRTLVWPLVVDEVLKAPLFGHGFGGIVSSGISIAMYEKYNHTYHHPHNAYLQTLIDNGILGTLPILLFYFVIVKYSWSLFRDARSGTYILAGGGAFAIVMTLLVASLTGQSFYPEERSFGVWCAMGLMLRVYVERLKLDGPKEKRKWKKSPVSNGIIWEERPL